jgi:outer membrane receptor protein involved in Fe transport
MRIQLIVASRCRYAPRTSLWGIGAVGALWTVAAIPPVLAASSGIDATLPETAVANTAVSPGSNLEEVTVSAERLELLGSASSASEGVVSDEELQLAPAYRPGQLLETVPGLIVTLHSGEGKANQYLLRGYNLDHGTDLETYVDGIPVNQVTHAHGQGYTDMNFLVPELASGLSYTKGPYYANVGDFGAVGSVRVNLRDTIPDEVSVTAGTFDFQRYFAAGSQPLGAGNLLAAAELQHYDGPFTNPDDARKENVVLRYSGGDATDGYAVTGMFYHQLWNNTTDIPVRAITEGLVGDRFGTLDPTDGGRSQRASLSAQMHEAIGAGEFTGNTYFEYSQLHIYNDFTHFLVDPVHGDQEDQFENRRVIGGAANYVLPLRIASFDNEFVLGALTRFDLLGVGRTPTEARVALSATDDPPSFYNSDHVFLFAAGAFLQATTHWTSAIRTVLGVRDDYQHGTDVDYLASLHESAGYTNAGTAHQSLLQPKGSLIYSVNHDLELYASAGQGFHSADLRGVDQDRSVNLGVPNTPLLAKQDGEELGFRAQIERNIAVTAAVFNLWQQSETIIDPDVGMDSAGPPSRRYGYEVNITYQINRHLEFYGSYSGDHTRFTHPLDDGTGHVGDYITDAPVATGSAALYFTHLGAISGGLNVRYLGSYPLSAGPCSNAAASRDFPGVATSCANAPTPPGQVNGRGFAQVNLDAHYAGPHGWGLSLGVYNLLNTHAPAAEFFYVDRLRSEIGTQPDGVADVHQHPLEPAMARLTISKQFDDL